MGTPVCGVDGVGVVVVVVGRECVGLKEKRDAGVGCGWVVQVCMVDVGMVCVYMHNGRGASQKTYLGV